MTPYSVRSCISSLIPLFPSVVASAFFISKVSKDYAAKVEHFYCHRMRPLKKEGRIYFTLGFLMERELP